MLSEALTSPSRSTIPAMVTTKPVTISVFCGNRLREALGSEGGGEDAERRRGEDDARLDRAVAANLLQVDRDDERRAQEHQPLDVLRDEREVARPVLEEPGGEQRLLPRSLPGADEEEERQQEDRADTRKIAMSALLLPA